MRFDPAALETWARANAEPLTYAAFFGLLLFFGMLEAALKRGPPPARPRRWSTNFALAFLWIVTGLLVPFSLLRGAELARDNGWGLLNTVAIAPAWAFAIGMLSRSFMSYAMHFFNHKVPLFWRFHRVHHLDTQLDISTTARFHPFEALVAAPFMIAGVIAVGAPPASVLLYEVLDAAIVVFTHANIRLPRWIDRLLSLVIVTPDMHRVHHSSFQPETDSNYGATLSIWDRLFGTYRRVSADALEAMELGLREVRDARAQRILWLFVSPVLSLRAK